MQRSSIANYQHKWFFDLPWHMVDLKDWFYMVNVGDLDPVYYLHVRIAGIRSLWVIHIANTRNLTTHEAKSGGAQVDPQDKPENDYSGGAWYCPECGWLLSGSLTKCPACDEPRPS